MGDECFDWNGDDDDDDDGWIEMMRARVQKHVHHCLSIGKATNNFTWPFLSHGSTHDEDTTCLPHCTIILVWLKFCLIISKHLLCHCTFTRCHSSYIALFAIVNFHYSPFRKQNSNEFNNVRHLKAFHISVIIESVRLDVYTLLKWIRWLIVRIHSMLDITYNSTETCENHWNLFQIFANRMH